MTLTTAEMTTTTPEMTSTTSEMTTTTEKPTISYIANKNFQLMRFVEMHLQIV